MFDDEVPQLFNVSMTKASGLAESGTLWTANSDRGKPSVVV